MIHTSPESILSEAEINGSQVWQGEDRVAEGKLLRQLIRSGAEGDLDVFRGVAKEVIAAERQKHHHLLANDLENILYGRTRPLPSPALQNLIASVPKDRERGFPSAVGSGSAERA